MESRMPLAIILSVVAVIGGMVLNFNEFLMGSPATVKNLIVTLVYISVWVAVLAIGIKNKDRRFLKYCFAFGSATLIVSAVTLVVNYTGASFDIVIPFVILLLSQWYGICYFVGSFLAASAAIAFISLVIAGIARAQLIKISKSEKNKI